MARMLNRDPSCEDDFDQASLTSDEALERILANVDPVEGHERLHLRSALGRILCETVVSPHHVPQHTNSAMDGYAIRAADLPTTGTGELRVVGTAFAGKPHVGTVAAGQAVRIMTGAVVPEGCDTVVMQEHVEAGTDAETIVLDGDHKRGQNVRAAGEDLARGATVLEPGHVIGSAELGLIASLGIGEVDVRRRVRVAYFSTGDELRSIGEPLGPGDVYDSNRYTLYGMLRETDAEIIDLGVVRDERDVVESALREASSVADLVITSGGVSVGEADYIKAVLAAIGEVRFWKVAMKPGRPLAFGRIGDAAFFGLPGNPVSVMVTFNQFVAPALRKMAGRRETRAVLEFRARATRALKKRPGRMEYQRGMLSRAADGSLEVTPTGDQGSGILRSMSMGNCYIILPIDCGRVEAGDEVAVQPFSHVV